jgi:glycosyltransferase involved in cell wall biosynthesis
VKILYFYQYFCTPKGSWSTRAYEFARRWVHEGDEVTIVTTVYDKSDLRTDRFLSRIFVDGIELRVVNIRISNRQSIAAQAATFVAFAAMSAWYALTLPADVVLASSGPLTMGLPGLLARYVRRKPFVFEVRDLWPDNAIQNGLLRNPVVIVFSRLLERACYRAAQFVVPLSDGMSDSIRHRFGLENVRVVPNASDFEIAEAAPVSSELPPWAGGKHIAVYAGSMGFIYDPEQLLRIAGHLVELGATDIQLVAIGTGRELDRVRALAATRRLTNIHFLGQLSRTEVFRWLKHARCALSIVRNNPFFDAASPNKVYDAFAAGIPVIQDTQGWIKRLLERTDAGVTVPRGDSRAMAEAIVALCRDDETHSRMCAAAVRVGRREFDRGVLAEAMRSVLYEAARVQRCQVAS